MRELTLTLFSALLAVALVGCATPPGGAHRTSPSTAFPSTVATSPAKKKVNWGQIIGAAAVVGVIATAAANNAKSTPSPGTSFAPGVPSFAPGYASTGSGFAPSGYQSLPTSSAAAAYRNFATSLPKLPTYSSPVAPLNPGMAAHRQSSRTSNLLTTPFPAIPSTQPYQPYQPYTGLSAAPSISGGNRFHPNSLANPFGAGSQFKADGLMNPFSQYGSQFSNKSWTNPFATNAPKLYDGSGNYRGRLSSNTFDPDSVSNPVGRFGGINSPLGGVNQFTPLYVRPQ